MPRPAKKAKLDLSDDESDAGVQLPQADGFTINEEYAKRFEHNKKREEQHRLEEKYAGNKRKLEESDDDDDDSSTDESEDDDAELATADVDEEIAETLRAIKSKDPRVYDTNVKFYKEFDPDKVAKEKTEKPMTLHDYHRQNLLEGTVGDDDDTAPMKTYAEEQEQLKRELVGSMHAAAEEDEDGDAGSDDSDFMVAKRKPKHESLPAKSAPKKPIREEDIAAADKDPEKYLSNFMSARAWLPTDGSSRFAPLESDDSDDDKRAELFEEAYNMRFEDPKTANEKLQSFARDVGKYGVRRDEKSGRAKQREVKREQKEAAKRERDEEKARLRKLRIDEVEEMVAKIKEAAGLRGKDVDLEEWRHVIEGDFENDKWEAEMKSRFGEDYYAEGEDDVVDDDDENKQKHRVSKPKWDDDIDIADLVPDFDDSVKPGVTLSDDEDGGAPLPDKDTDEEDEADTTSSKKRKTKKDREKQKADAKRAARKERQKIEEIVDASLPLQHPTLSSASTSKAPVVGFRYRETSPTSFGLSARDILFADDTALNSFAGLKKMAAFRDEEKKARDRKKFSKKQRLKQWRKETFGDVEEPSGGFERVFGQGDSMTGANAVEVHGAEKKSGKQTEENKSEGKRKKNRKSKSKKAKTSATP